MGINCQARQIYPDSPQYFRVWSCPAGCCYGDTEPDIETGSDSSSPNTALNVETLDNGRATCTDTIIFAPYCAQQILIPAWPKMCVLTVMKPPPAIRANDLYLVFAVAQFFQFSHWDDCDTDTEISIPLSASSSQHQMSEGFHSISIRS